MLSCKKTKGYRSRVKKVPDEEVVVTDEMPDGDDITASDTEQTATRTTTRKSRPSLEDRLADMRRRRGAANRQDETFIYTVSDNKQLISEGLLVESSKTQWAISPKQLKALSGIVDYEELGTLPISDKRVVDVAEQYMDNLGESLRNIFAATSNLSENINEYFTYEDRSQAISSGNEAIKDSQIITKEMQQQLAQDSTAPGNIKESFNLVENQGKRIALFPGKFKPPHKGHYDFCEQSCST